MKRRFTEKSRKIAMQKYFLSTDGEGACTGTLPDGKGGLFATDLHSFVYTTEESNTFGTPPTKYKAETLVALLREEGSEPYYLSMEILNRLMDRFVECGYKNYTVRMEREQNFLLTHNGAHYNWALIDKAIRVILSSSTEPTFEFFGTGTRAKLVVWTEIGAAYILPMRVTDAKKRNVISFEEVIADEN